jgi:hypothetical protein
MSRGKNLQEMETGTKQSKTAVNAGAKAAEPMHKLTTGIPDGQTGSWEDLGGPTPENYKPDDDSAKLSTPGATLKQVKNVVNKGAKAADAMKSLAKESVEEDEDEELIDDEAEYDEDEVVSEAKKKSSKGEDEEGEDEDEEGEDEDSEEDDEEDKKEKAMKEAFAQIEEEIEEDVNALLSGEELSEDFKVKAKTVFEAALNARTEQIEEAIVHQYEQKLAEEVETIREELTDRLDAYLEYVSEEWLQENALEVEQGLKTEMTESFLAGMKSLFEDHYVTIPEDRYDVLENVALNRRLAESVTEVIFAEVSEGLALSQKDKLASLAENVEFDSESDYREKLVTLRESYFPRNAGTQRDNSDYIVEETDYSQPVSGSMSRYLDTLQRVAKK